MSQIANIQLLDQKTINRIAAGEVIERPASIVKELMENSIDAQAKSITISIEGAGKELIRVEDDGVGIRTKEVKIAFDMHTTSKIRKSDDIFQIQTMGFRGEALASISAVSRVEMLTKHDAETKGSRIVIEGGRVITQEESSHLKGTRMEIRSLFYNTPARLKFMKSDLTERNHIAEVVTKNAIILFERNIQLLEGSKQLVKSPPRKDLLEAIIDIWGIEYGREMIKVEKEIDDKIVLTGYIAKPSLTKKDRNKQYFYINNRPIDSPQLSSAVEDGFGPLLMKRRYPVVVLNLEMPPDHIDVNIHPAKREVRFEKEAIILGKISETIEEILKENDLFPEITDEATAYFKPITRPSQPSSTSSQPRQSNKIPLLPHRPLQTKAISQQLTFQDDDIDKKQLIVKPETERKSERITVPLSREESFSFDELLLKCQVLDTYMISEVKDQVLIIDLHAAHERVVYEKIEDATSNSSISSQQLIKPYFINLSAIDLERIKEAADLVTKLGLLVNFHEEKLEVLAIPFVWGRILSKEEIEIFVSDLIDFLSDEILSNLPNSKNPIEEFHDKIISLMGCHGAIRSGETIDPSFAQKIIKELFNCRHPEICIHGRPTILKLSRQHLDRLFHRIVD
ncbi:MAG: DNA mismatch repair endonuclease MutL [Candidatus Kariarchaeaceae archaeon]